MDNSHYDLSKKFLQNLEEQNLLNEFRSLLNDNPLFDFLFMRFESDRLKGKNWIDFEADIRQVVFHFEQAEKQNKGNYYVLSFNTSFPDENDYMTLLLAVARSIRARNNSSNYLRHIHASETIFLHQEFVDFSEHLFQNLRALVRAFELYCHCLINQINHDFIKNTEIQKLSTLQESVSAFEENRSLSSDSEKLNALQGQYVEWRILRDKKFDCVLSFNYTNTFSSRYGTTKTKYCFMHGIAQSMPDKTNLICNCLAGLIQEEF